MKQGRVQETKIINIDLTLSTIKAGTPHILHLKYFKNKAIADSVTSWLYLQIHMDKTVDKHHVQVSL